MAADWDEAPGGEAFEAAIGRFILAFGVLEELAGHAIAREFNRLGRRNPIDPEASFGHKLMALDLLQAAARSHDLKVLPIDRIRALSRERNILIHGQSAVHGRPRIETRREKARAFPPDRLDRLTAEAEEIIDLLIPLAGSDDGR